MSPDDTWEFRVLEARRIVDGDTYDLLCDLGFRQFGIYRFRLKDVDTPEIYGGKEPGADEAKRYVEDWFTDRLADPDLTVWVRSYAEQTFSRWVADVYAEGGGYLYDLADQLVAHGHAQPV